MRIAFFPGTFDPFTLGHEEIVRRALTLFDQIVIGIGVNSAKTFMFSEAQRLDMIRQTFEDEKRVKAETFSGLSAIHAQKLGACAMLRGIRNAIDLEYEKPIAAINAGLAKEVETIFLVPSGATAHISSTLVREVIRYKGDVSQLLSPTVIRIISTAF